MASFLFIQSLTRNFWLHRALYSGITHCLLIQQLDNVFLCTLVPHMSHWGHQNVYVLLNGIIFRSTCS